MYRSASDTAERKKAQVLIMITSEFFQSEVSMNFSFRRFPKIISESTRFFGHPSDIRETFTFKC
jgi:hypothetical protein